MSSPISSGKEIFLIEILRRKNCQEGVVEVKEVLKDAVEHLPDGHRWVIYLKTIKLKIFQTFFCIVINSYALACACANSVSSFNTFKGRHSGSWILDGAHSFFGKCQAASDIVQRNRTLSGKASLKNQFPKKAPFKNFYVRFVERKLILGFVVLRSLMVRGVNTHP